MVSPWSLTWDDENYYLVGFDADTEKIKHYRVDKMQEIRVINEARLGWEHFKGFDLAAFARKTFGMFGGKDRQITLEAEDYLAGPVIDRFGTDIILIPCNGGNGANSGNRGNGGNTHQFHVSVTVTVSPQFFGWLTGLGEGIRISWPEDVRKEYQEYLQRVLDASSR